MTVRFDEPGRDVGAGRVDLDLAIRREARADLDHDAGTHAHVGTSRRRTRAIDERAAANQELAHVLFLSKIS